jgi:hypothetical protein
MDFIKLILFILFILLILVACGIGFWYWINLWIDGTFKVRCAMIAFFVLVGMRMFLFDKDSN